MMQRSTTRRGARAWKRSVDRGAPVLAASLYVGVMAAAYPFRHVFEFDPDEGINAIKAVLVDRGYQLYSQIWNDQPPLFTYLLEWWCRAFGWETNTGRMLVLLFAGLIIFAIYDTLRGTYGHRAAVAVVVLLPCTAYFTQLSVSIMLGLPAIAFATLCVWALVRWALTQRARWLLTAGVLMGLSLGTKLFTIFLVPVFGLWVFLVAAGQHGLTKSWRVLTQPAAWALTVLLTATSLLVLCVPLRDSGQLYQSHVSARGVGLAEHQNDLALLHGGLLRDWEVFALAGLGTALMLRRRRGVLAILPAWCCAAYWALRANSPLWYHHHLLLTVPASMIAGIAIGDLLSRKTASASGSGSAVDTALRVATLLISVSLFAALVRSNKAQPAPLLEWSDRDRFALEIIKAYPKRSEVIVADRPMYAFAAGYEVPPNLAVISQKRLASHNLTIQEFIETIDRENPEHVVFSWKLPAEYIRSFTDTMKDRYRLIYADMDQVRLRLFVRSDVVGDPLPALLHAAELVPSVAPGHDAIGIEWAARGDAAQAIASFRRAHELDPTAIHPSLHLAEAYMSQGDYANGFAVLQSGMRARGAARNAPIVRAYAWRRATCPDAQYRNGAEAEATARAITGALEQPALLDLEIIAAGLAAQRKFEAAREAAERALDRAQHDAQDQAVRRLTLELESYRRREVWTVPVQMPTS